MRTSRTLFCYLFCVLITAGAARGQTTWYVDDDGGVSATCTSWADACPDLQTALGLAVSGDQIWVAEGVYKPDAGTGDRTATFQLITGVGIYGGFDGTETTLEERAGLFDQTILSGDIDNNDVPVPCTQDSPDCNSYGGLCFAGFCMIKQNNGENSYNILNGSGTDATTVLDGFTVTGGNANGIGEPYDAGGGMYTSAGSPTLANCTLTGNSAQDGGAMYSHSSSATLINCRFSGNTAGGSGGGVYNWNSNPTVANCTFSGNSAWVGGGMWNNSYSSLTLANCVFAGNMAGYGAGVTNNSHSSPTLTNCIFTGNRAGVRGGAMYNSDNSDPTLTNCIVWGDAATTGAEIYNYDGSSTPTVTYSDVQGGYGGEGNIDEDPLFVDADGPDGVVGTADDNLRLLAGSPAINAGTNSPPGGLPATDLDGNPRIMHGIVDMGAYEQLLVHNVTQDTFHAAIQFAIDDAQGGDVIEASPGVYHEAIDFLGRAITLRSSDGPEVTTIDASGLNTSVVKCVSGEGPGTLLDGFTITGGAGSVDLPWRVGGGMYIRSSTPTVLNCMFTRNTADLGSGIYLQYSNATVVGCTFSGHASGSGMYNDGSNAQVSYCTFRENAPSGMMNFHSSPTVTNCTFIGNGSTNTNGGGMGNWRSPSSSTVADCVFTGNVAEHGGGIHSERGTSPTVVGCTFIGNTALQSGGAMLLSGTSTGPTVVIANSTFAGNTAGRVGGALGVANDDLALTNCVFIGNTANDVGGGLIHSGGSATLTNCTFSHNLSNSRRGGVSCGGETVVTNCILWRNESPTDPQIGGYATVTFSDVMDDDPDDGVVYPGKGNIDDDPLFVRNPDPGVDLTWGTTDDDYGAVHLRSNSPCMDAGNDRAIVIPAAGIDHDGNPRIVDGDSDSAPRVDMGAYEYSDCNENGIRDTCDIDCSGLGGDCNVDGCGHSSDDDDDGFPDECEAVHNVTQDTYDATIQIVINNAVDGDVIEVPPGSYREAIDFFGKAVTLRSTDGPEATTIHGSSLGTSVVKCVSEEGPDTVVEGFTITGGTGITDQDTGETFGGGMYVENSDPTVTGCIFTENLAFYGAGLACSHSSPVVTECTFSRNLSYEDGGGVYCSQDCAATLVNCLFSGNSAQQNGGALANDASDPTITNCTFSGNSAGTTGGAIVTSSGSPTLANCILWGDTPDEIYGPAIVAYSDVEGGYMGTGNVDADPGFIGPHGAGNTLGTPADDLHLSAGSPCIDAGDNTVPALVGITTDFDGSARFADDPTVDPDPGNGTPPVVDMGAYEYQADCNANGIIDSLDITEGTCPDDNDNGVPDVCQADCNRNGQHDAVDLAQGTSADCNGDAIPDECEPDCDLDGTPDLCELSPYGTSEDCTGNEIPDECEADCNHNDVADSCDIADGTSVDGNENGLPDSCEMPDYNIGPDIDGIPAQAAVHGSTVEFLVYSSELGEDATFSIVADPPPVGPIAVDPTTGYFSYTPDPADKRTFMVTFTAALGGDSVSQDVPFEPTPLLPDESEVLGLEPVHPVPDPESGDYIVRNVVYSLHRYNLANPDEPLECCIPPNSSDCIPDCPSFNWNLRNTRSITIAGKTLAFEAGNENGLYDYSDNKDIEDLTIFAETVVIRDPLHFPQTNVTVYARELRFEDDVDDNERSYIDTTPESPLPLGPGGGDGDSGLKAGDITLHLQSFQAPDDHVRFIMEGGVAQDGANGLGEDPPGAPGAGGSAGNLYANLASLPHPVCAGGPPGKPGWVGDPAVYAALPDVPFGQSGSIVQVGNDWSWLAPDALRMILAHSKDAYLYGHLDEAEAILAEYRGLLETYRDSDAWPALDDPEKDENWQFELTQLLEETITLLHRLQSNLDYFGNPAGWVPMLSFEVLYAAFEQEVDRSVDALYLAYWVGNAVRDLDAKIGALRTAQDQLRDEIVAYESQYEDLIDLIPSLEAQALDIASQIDQRMIELQQLEQELLARAQEIVEERHKVPWWKKALRALGGICKIVPVGQPALGAVGGGMDFVTNIDPNQPWSSITGLADVASGFSQGGFRGLTGDWLTALREVDRDEPSSKQIGGLLGASSSIGQALQGVGNLFRQTQAPRTEVEAELQKIKASDPAFIALTDRIQELMNDKAALAHQLASAIQTVSDLAGRISHNVLAIDGFNRDISEGTAALDHRVARYVEEMDRRARERLQKYHYYMAKAYEYRLLERYPGDLNLDNMFTLMQTIVDAGSNENLSAGDFDDLKGLYEGALADIAENIIDGFVYFPPEQSSQTRLTLSADQLDRVNAGELVLLNLAELPFGYDPVFLGCEENIRILDISVHEMDGHTVQGGDDSFVKVFIQHSGVSRLHSQGNTYRFVHYTERTANRITWEVKYYPLGGSWFPTVPSAETASLLRVLLSQDDWDEYSLMYSRPGADAELMITRTVSSGAVVVIDSLVLDVTYDFYRQPETLANLTVRVSENGLLPYFVVSESDKNDRRDGRGSFYRAYASPTNVMTVEAPTTYGSWEFEKWTDCTGNDLPDGPMTNPQLELSLDNNPNVPCDDSEAQIVVAQFCRFGLLADVSALVSCMNGPFGQTASSCFCVDDDDDGDVDLADFAALQLAFEGP
ncbi:MAG: hypothetical protein JSU86_19935 [Phycisphaerales bacterium]|nr:MAG: hypothetical protein JSU86_19935 [Phycisphaerales bacterium]